MGANRVLKLTNQGELQCFEGSAGGTSKITLKAPATLAGEVTFQLPGTNGSSGQFLKTDGNGVTSWDNGTSTLQSAWDNGRTIVCTGGYGIPITASTGACLQVSQANPNGPNLSLTNTSSSVALDINVTSGTGYQILSDKSFKVYNDGAISCVVYTDGGRPAATNYSAGTMIWNSTDNAPNWSDGTNWRDAVGNTT